MAVYILLRVQARNIRNVVVMFHGSSMTARYQMDGCDMVLWSGEKGLEFMRCVDEAVQVTHPFARRRHRRRLPRSFHLSRVRRA